MKYIPLVALLLYQTIAIGAEELPTQVTPYDAPQIILAQEEEAEGTGAPQAECPDNESQAQCEAAANCTWTDDEECVDVDDDIEVDDE